MNFQTCAEIDSEDDIEEHAFESRRASSLLKEPKMLKFFDLLIHLPYTVTASLTTVLKYLEAQEHLTNRWKVCLLLMGLTFHNPNARAAWFLLYSSLLHTWELITKFKKPI